MNIDKNTKLSICVTVKNRSRLVVDGRELRLFPNCVKSIVESLDPNIDLELVVSDWESNDWPLEHWLHEAAKPIPVQIISLAGTFSRGKGLNVAASAARADTLFFIDADAMLSKEVFRAGIEYVTQGKAYFPILYSFEDPNHQTGEWRASGYGHCMIQRSTYMQTAGWPEYKSWGREDIEFWESVSSIQEVSRERVKGLYHQWHPTDIDWKNQHGIITDVVLRERARRRETHQARIVMNELGTVVPEGARYIFVDEDRFRGQVDLSRSVPFLERDGTYWGRPADDATAIAELDRLRSAGTRFIAFPWITFWWLDHYTEFNDYLRSTSNCVLTNERLIIFEVR